MQLECHKFVSTVHYLVLPFLKGLRIILTNSLFALAVKYTVYCSTAILVVVVVPQLEAQPLKVHLKTCQVVTKHNIFINI